MFKRGLRKVNSVDEETEENNEEIIEENFENINFEDFEVQSPGCPGLQILLEEEKQERNKPPSNKKFDKAREVCKSFTDLLPQCNNKTFEQNITALETFANLMRSGLPEALVKYLSNAENYDIVLEEKSSSEKGLPKAPSTTSTSTLEVSASPESSVPSYFTMQYLEIPNKPYEKITFDAVIMKMKGDGACFF